MAIVSFLFLLFEKYLVCRKLAGYYYCHRSFCRWRTDQFHAEWRQHDGRRHRILYGPAGGQRQTVSLCRSYWLCPTRIEQRLDRGARGHELLWKLELSLTSHQGLILDCLKRACGYFSSVQSDCYMRFASWMATHFFSCIVFNKF